MTSTHATASFGANLGVLGTTSRAVPDAQRRSRFDGALSWLEDVVYKKLTDRSPQVAPPVALAQRLFGFTALNTITAEVEAQPRAAQFGALANALDLNFEVRGLENLKAVGNRPVILFGNHPTGGGNVLGMCMLLAEHFSDYRIFGNRHMAFLSSLTEKMIAVDPFHSACALNLDALLDVRRDFGTKYQALGVFPAGMSSQFDLAKGIITDRRWSDAFMRIARHHDAVLVPVWFSGRNRLRYYFASKIRTELGFLALASEFLHLRGQTIAVNIGSPVSVDVLRQIPKRHAQMSFLRAGVYELARERAVAISPQPALGRMVTRDNAGPSWQILDWQQSRGPELDHVSPIKRTFRLPRECAEASRWLEIVGCEPRFGSVADIRKMRRVLAASAPERTEVVALLYPSETNSALASLQLAMLQKLYGDAALLHAQPRAELIADTRHHDWRPQRDVAELGQRPGDGWSIDPALQKLGRLGVRFGAAGLSSDANPRPCILARFKVPRGI